VGVLEGIELERARDLLAFESELTPTLTIPIAAALSNSVRIADAERMSLTTISLACATPLPAQFW